jgi:signal transduction protein with GAF and PtsI domain
MGGDAASERRLAEARWQAVGEIAVRIAAGDALEDVLQAIATHARATLGSGAPLLAATDDERAAVGVRPAGFFLLTADRRELELHGGVNFPPEQIGMHIGAGFGLPGIVVRTGEPLVVPNTDDDPRFKQIISTGRAGSTCQIPIKVEGHCLGVAFVASMAKDIYGPADMEALKVYAALASAAIRAAGGYHGHVLSRSRRRGRLRRASSAA